jgi:hypothetical protein
MKKLSEKCCGTCNWWKVYVSKKKRKHCGYCECPFPLDLEAVVYGGCGYGVLERKDMSDFQGTACPCWVKKVEENG